MLWDWTALLAKISSPIIGALVVAVAGVILALLKGLISLDLTLDQLVAIAASVGSCAAALATYGTIREMRASRIAAARARLAIPGSDLTIRFVWSRKTDVELMVPTQKILVRNASSGAAYNIDVDWKCDFDLTTGDIANVSRWLAPKHAAMIASESSVAFSSGGIVTGGIAVSKDDISYLGDLGPSQDMYCVIPPQILSMVFLKWVSLLSRSEAVSYQEVPLVRLTFAHDSPYEKRSKDEHLVRFELVDYALKRRAGKAPAGSLGGNWHTFEVTMAFEPAARKLYDIPKVVVPLGGGGAS